MVKTTISLEDTTVKKMKKHARKDETYDDFVNRALKELGWEK